jgi:predicted nucleic acid-binding protein
MIKLISIDSQIWIYYLDANAVENKNVLRYLDGKEEDGILFKEKILITTIIPLEVAHNFFRNEEIDPEKAYEIITNTFHLQNLEIKEVSMALMEEALKILAKNRKKGIGGRDAIILATLEQEQVDTIITHDKNLLELKNLRRIDPVFNPPLLLETGEKFDQTEFKEKLRDL